VIARHTYAKVALPATVDVTPPEPLVMTKAVTTVDEDPKRSVESNTALIQRDMKNVWTVSGSWASQEGFPRSNSLISSTAKSLPAASSAAKKGPDKSVGMAVEIMDAIADTLASSAELSTVRRAKLALKN
jgi:hypothetical protein